MKQFHWCTFEDGYSACVAGYSASELKTEIAKHGSVVKIARA